MRVASRYYKGPELLVEDKLYHYSLDVWSLGCTMAGMIFRVDPFFKGSDNNDQLVRIAKIMGTEDLITYVRKYKINMPSQFTKILKNYPKVEFEELISKNNQHLISEDALDLLRRLLHYDKNLRITPIEAMNHPYFHPVKQYFAS